MDKQTQEVMFSSKSDMWATPVALYEKLNKFYNFTLDPCATPETAKCTKYYTEQDDGLSKDWSGEVVFVNPPYSNIAAWAEKCYNERNNNNVVSVMLIPSRTDTKWFHKYCIHADLIQFIKGRVKFENGEDKTNSAPFPSMLVIFDNRIAKNGPFVTGFTV